MSTVTVIGGTGYAGSAIVREAVRRGHDVVSFSRTAPEGDARVEGVRYETGSMTDADTRARAVAGSEVVVTATAPRGELDGAIVEVDLALAALAVEHGVRFGVIGGFSSLRPSEGAPRFTESGDLPPEFASEALQMDEVLTRLGQTPDELDWFFVSPAMQFGLVRAGRGAGSLPSRRRGRPVRCRRGLRGQRSRLRHRRRRPDRGADGAPRAGRRRVLSCGCRVPAAVAGAPAGVPCRVRWRRVAFERDTTPRTRHAAQAAVRRRRNPLGRCSEGRAGTVPPRLAGLLANLRPERVATWFLSGVSARARPVRSQI